MTNFVSISPLSKNYNVCLNPLRLSKKTWRCCGNVRSKIPTAPIDRIPDKYFSERIKLLEIQLKEFKEIFISQLIKTAFVISAMILGSIFFNPIFFGIQYGIASIVGSCIVIFAIDLFLSGINYFFSHKNQTITTTPKKVTNDLPLLNNYLEREKNLIKAKKYSPLYIMINGPILEEIIFRGGIQALGKKILTYLFPNYIYTSIKIARLISSFLFGLAHFAEDKMQGLLVGTNTYFVECALMEKYGLVAPIVSHITNNTVIQIFFNATAFNNILSIREDIKAEKNRIRS